MRSFGMGRSVARLVVAIWAAAAVAPTAVMAQNDDVNAGASPLVVELFTSQGCSACPPADALLHELDKRDDVIALALHVDYWDYIGWADKFARPEHTVRQKAYARAAGERMIYTPQMILGGAERVVGAKAMSVVAAIDAHRAVIQPVVVQLEREGDTLSVSVQATGAVSAPMVVQLVRYQPEGRVDVLRGENAGKTLSYTNIVTAWDVVAKWEGGAPLSLSLETPGNEPSVVIVQEADHGEILAAARVK